MKTILLAEDEAMLMDLYSTVIKKNGFEVLPASNGLEALEILKDKKPDLIVSDLAMPDLDGAGLLAQLRAKPETKDTPVIILTNMSDPSVIANVTSLHADYLVKSEIKPIDVVNRINELLGKK